MLSPSLATLRSTLPEKVSAALVTAEQISLGVSRSPHQGGGDLILPTGLAPLDHLLGGGLPKGVLVELVGRQRSTGRFTVGLYALASATKAGEAAALVDLGDHLDPQAAEAEGVRLSRLLWLRPRKLKDALAAAETVLAAGFALAVLDLGVSRTAQAPHAAWVRLARAAAVQRAALLILSPRRVTGATAGIVLSVEASKAAWSSSLLHGLTARFTLEKRRGERPGEVGLLRLNLAEVVVRPAHAADVESVSLLRPKVRLAHA